MSEVSKSVIRTFGDHYEELSERASIIQETLQNEEALFRRTLERGTELLGAKLAGGVTVLEGETAFQLYDTFGFPLEVTQEICGEQGVHVDIPGYEAALKRAQELSRGAQGDTAVYGETEKVEVLAVDNAPESSEFKGYQHLSAETRIVEIIQGTKPVVVLQETPFYAASGGQIGDTGEIVVGETTVKVIDTTKVGGKFMHKVDSASADLLGKQAHAFVNQSRRKQIQRNHSATHLLHAALREVLGNHVTQAGSYVGPDNLRFDFTHGKALTESEIAQIERMVNGQILENICVTTYADIPIEESKAKGAMALFGEKYGNLVRMVEIGDFSRELCGGTHVKATGEIGMLKVISEGSAASGVRRIEAITGEAVYAMLAYQTEQIKSAAGLLKVGTSDLIAGVTRIRENLSEERKKRQAAEKGSLLGEGIDAEKAIVTVGDVQLWSKNFGEGDPKVVGELINTVSNNQPNQVTLGLVVSEGRLQFFCKIGAEAVAKGAHAGNLLKSLAQIAGGGGGGRAEYATAGGKDVSKAKEALEAASGILISQQNG